MSVYFLLLFWSFISGIIFIRKGIFSVNDIGIKKIYFVMNYLPLAIISGLRYKSVGSDTEMYHWLFYAINRTSFDFSYLGEPNHIEIGYRLLNVLIGLFTNDSQMFMLVVTFIMIFGYGHFFYKMSSNFYLTTFLFIGLFFYCETMNTLRQSLAMMIAYNSLVFLLKEKYRYWWLGVGVASLFHISAVLFACAFFVKKLKQKDIVWFGIGVAFFIFVLKVMMEDILPIFDLGKYLLYINMQDGFGLGDIFRILICMICLLLWQLYHKKFTFEENKNGLFFAFMTLLTAGLSFSEQYFSGFYRITMIFSVFILLLLPLVIKYMGKIKIILYPIMFSLVVIVFYIQLNNNIHQLLYKFFL